MRKPRPFGKIKGFKCYATWAKSASYPDDDDFNVPDSPDTARFFLVFKKDKTKFKIEAHGTQGCCVRFESFFKGPVLNLDMIDKIEPSIIKKLVGMLVAEGLPAWCSDVDRWEQKDRKHVCPGSGDRAK